MEIKSTIHRSAFLRVVLAACLVWFACTNGTAQVPEKSYTVKNGKMFIYLDKLIREQVLDSFILQFNLNDLGLKQFIRKNIFDSLQRQGWAIERNDEQAVIISKSLMGFDPLKTPGDKIAFYDKAPNFAAEFPAVSNRVVFGNNRFRNKAPFRIENAEVTFFLRNTARASRVNLAGSFNNWDPNSLRMTRTDSGWIAKVKLNPGKYWYKFIIDGNWRIDSDNSLAENDGKGNTNSIFYRTNMLFFLPGFAEAKRVYLAGSFNDWQPRGLEMTRTATGWELPLYLADGTHAYKFVVDGRWYEDPRNPDKIPDGQGGNNSVFRLGDSYVFKLDGFTEARQVMLAGSFNKWRDFELAMKRTPTGWELPYTLAPGNYEYKFKVDGKWIADPANLPNKASASNKPNEGNSYLVYKSNYTFRLKGFPNAKAVYLAGDFNNWNPTAYPLRREGEEWVFSLHLSPGKVRYKYIVDGAWILDPGNKLWEQNEHRTGNSILWIE